MRKTSKTITLRQIAKLAHTSKSTVSRVLTKHPSVSPKTRARINQVIQKQGFRPNLFAQGLAGGRTGLVAVLTSEINSGFYAEVIKGIDQVASQHDGHLLSSFAHGPEDYIELWRSFAVGGRVDGMILIAPPLDLLSHRVRPDDVPVVLCSCRPHANAQGWEHVDSITVDNQKGINELMRHLVDQEHKRFTHIAGPDDVYDATERRRAFEQFLLDHPSLAGEVIQTAMTREGGRTAVLEYLKKGDRQTDAFVACNDLSALGTLEALKESRINVPQSVAVTGCDDDPSSAILGLTTLHMPMIDLGREAGRLLFDRLGRRDEQPLARHSLVEMTLRVRATSLIKS
jgi:LacI family transcriptional regulator